jgi:hypothetical protein
MKEKCDDEQMRYLYFSDPKNRTRGFFGYGASIVHILCTVSTAIQLLLG